MVKLLNAIQRPARRSTRLAALASITLAVSLGSAGAQDSGGSATYQWVEGITPIPAGAGSSIIQGSVTAVGGTSVDRKSYFTDEHYNIPEGVEVGTYFATWGVYGRNYFPQDVPVERLSAVYIAFAAICGDNAGAHQGGAGARRSCNNPHVGEAGPYYIPDFSAPLTDDQVTFIDDEWAWLDKQMLANSTSLPDSMIATMMGWKGRNPDLKILVSLGGWSYSRPFYDVLNDSSRRQVLVQSIVDTLSQPGFDMIDGIDIDYEYPGGGGLDAGKGNPAVDGANYLTFVQELRAALDELEAEMDRIYMITAAIGVGEDKLANWLQSSTIGEFLDVVDRLGLMTYDFEGAWSGYAGFNSALDEPGNTPQIQTIKGAINALTTSHGVTQDQFSKISIGYPSYTRSTVIASGITDPSAILFATADGGGDHGTVEAGILSYFDLYERVLGADGNGINGWKVYSYPEFGASLAYNPSTGEVHTFMSPADVAAVADYAKDEGLRGVFSWQIDDDNGALLQSALDGLGLTPATSAIASSKSVVYAPDCDAMVAELGSALTIKPSMTFSSCGNVYRTSSWATNCPGEGENWEQAQWTNLGSISDFIAFGAGWTSDELSAADGDALCAAREAGGTQPSDGTGDNQVDDGQSGGGAGDSRVGGGQPNADSNDSNAWSSTVAYTQGAQVTHAGTTWEARWWTQGEEPGVVDVWTDLSGGSNTADDPASDVSDPSGGADDPASNGNDPASDVNDPASDVNDPAGDSPGVDDPANSGGGSDASDTWSASEIYTQGMQVIYGGVAWEAQWWTQGEEPGSSEWGAWRQAN